jgi:hypothetical protein
MALVAARAGGGATCPREEHQRGCLSGGRASWGPCGAGRAARGQLAAGGNAGNGRWAALQRNREGKQEEEDEDLFVNFAKVQGVNCKVKFSSKL